MNIYTEFEKELLERLSAIESRLESIEQMLKVDFIDPNQYGAIPDEPEWQTGFPPENKMVIIRTRRDNNHFGYITKQGFYNIFVIDGSVVKEVTRPSFLFDRWREMTKEENTLCWERGILGASEEHAELSKLELPTAKPEPEWRPMSTAPKDKDIKVKLNGEVRIAWYYSKDEWSVSGCVLPESYFEGWRPL